MSTLIEKKKETMNCSIITTIVKKKKTTYTAMYSEQIFIHLCVCFKCTASPFLVSSNDDVLLYQCPTPRGEVTQNMIIPDTLCMRMSKP